MKTILITDKNIKSKKFDIVIDIRKMKGYIVEEIVKNVYKGRAKYPEKDRNIINKIKAESKIYLNIKNKLYLILFSKFLWDYGFEIYLIYGSKNIPIKMFKDITIEFILSEQGNLNYEIH